MYNTRKHTKDNKSMDFVYEEVRKTHKEAKKSAGRNRAGVKTGLAWGDAAEALLDEVVKETGIKTPHGEEKSPNLNILSSISELEKRIHELECNEIMMQKQKSEVPARLSSQKMLSMKDIANSEAYAPTCIDREEEDDAIGKQSPIKSKIKSGYEVHNQMDIIKKVLWPHGFLNKIQHVANVKPDHLSPESFIYGYSAILLQMQTFDPQELRGRIMHLQQIMWHAIMNDWPSARSFHYQVLREIESGNMGWSDQQDMMMMSLTSAHENINHGKAQPTGTNSYGSNMWKDFNTVRQNFTEGGNDGTGRSIFCNMFNYSEDGCKFEKGIDGCKKLHACVLCAKKGFFNKHKAMDCNK